MEKLLNFNREESGKWFVVLPEYEGVKEDLEMVMGSDTMLDVMEHISNTVTLKVSDKPFPFAHQLKLVRREYEGATYMLDDDFEVWLCSVLAFVFGTFPENIYFFKQNAAW